jgi:uncharacterized repeat protein (TIGR01451 family)
VQTPISARILFIVLAAIAAPDRTLGQNHPQSERPVPPLAPIRSSAANDRDTPRELQIVAPPDDEAASKKLPRTLKTPVADPLPDILQATPLPERPNVAREEAATPRKLTGSRSPLVTVEIVGPESATLGQSLTYEILVRNLSDVTAQRITVEQDLPSNVKYVSGDPPPDERTDRLIWKLEKLDAGSERRLRVKALAKEDGEFQTQATVSFALQSACITRITKPNLGLKMTAPDWAVLGEEIAFKIEISNTGSARLQQVVLRDLLPDGLTHPQGREIEADVGPLAPGEKRTIVLKALATKSGNMVNEITATASVAGADGVVAAGGVKSYELDAAAKTTVRVGEPGLSVKQIGPKTCQVRSEALFTIEASNNGTAITRNVRVQNRLPANMEFVAASDEGRFDPASRTVTWSLGALDFGTKRVLSVKARAVTSGEVVNSVNVQADGNLTARSEFHVMVEGAPALSVEILDLDNPAPVRTDVMYEIRVLNQGTAPCTNLQISLSLPEGMILRDAQSPTPYKLEDSNVVFAPFAKLATRADLVYRIKVQSKKSGNAKLRVQLTADQLQRPVIREEISRFLER